MPGIDDLFGEIRDTANDRLRGWLPGASVDGFGAGPTLLLAALGTRGNTPPPAGTANDGRTPQPITRELVEKVLQEAADRAGVPVRPDEARKVLELLRTGELHRDLASGVTSLLVLVHVAPSRLVDEVLALPTLPGDLLRAVASDLSSARSELATRQLLRDIKDGRIDDPPNFLRETLRVVLSRATINGVVETVRSLIAPENETFRLALMVYARSQGFDVTEKDIDALHAALDPENPNLGLLFDSGLQYVRRRTGGAGEASEIIQRLGFLTHS